MTRRLFYTDHCVLPLPPEHKFPIGKYRMLREVLVKEGLFSWEEGPLAHMATIVLAHDAEYVEAFLQGTLSAGSVRRIGFPWSPGLVRRTLASVGSTLAATREAVATGWGGTLAGGTHHAFAAEGSGFCVFNDIAVAARWVHRERCLQRGRAAVIDLDVHQGDGRADDFRGDAAVMTRARECNNDLPCRKQR